jgi:hypothetical protein
MTSYKYFYADSPVTVCYKTPQDLSQYSVVYPPRMRSYVEDCIEDDKTALLTSHTGVPDTFIRLMGWKTA